MLAQDKKMFPFLLDFTIGWLKPGFYWAFSIAAAWLAGKFAQFLQAAPPPAVWYESPAFIGGVVAGIFILAKELLDWAKQSRKEKKAGEEENDKRQITFSEKIQELTLDERKSLLGGLIQLHEKEVQVLEEKAESEVKFWKREFAIKSRGEYEARMRAHRFGNEVNRLNAHVFMLHAAMSKVNIDIPEFELRTYEQLMEGLDEEVEKHQSTLAERHDRTRRKH